MPIELSDIVAARSRIEGAVARTPCPESEALSALCKAVVFAKREYTLPTGSFKERGACNALMLLNDDARRKGVIAASAGNHALALAHHGRLLGVPVTVVMPRFAPLIKQARCRQMGARVILLGADIAESKGHAEELIKAEGLTYIHGFDGPAVIAGQGTIGLELLEQVRDLDAIVCPVGGAGLLAGVALAVKSLAPGVRIIGVEPVNCPSLAEAMRAGHAVTARCEPTLADGLAVPRVGENAFALVRERVDEVVSVTEDEIALAILRLIELEKGVVEGAGATPLAAMLSGRLASLEGQRVALLLCGGNIDPAVLGRVIERGLVVDGRLTRFTASISDRPGGLRDFASAIAGIGASIREVDHERAFSTTNVSRVTVHATIETRDRAHAQELAAALARTGIEIVPLV